MIQNLLGKGSGVYGEDPEETDKLLYTSHRDVPYGHLLLIHFVHGRVDTWEWASE